MDILLIHSPQALEVTMQGGYKRRVVKKMVLSKPFKCSNGLE